MRQLILILLLLCCAATYKNYRPAQLTPRQQGNVVKVVTRHGSILYTNDDGGVVVKWPDSTIHTNYPERSKTNYVIQLQWQLVPPSYPRKTNLVLMSSTDLQNWITVTAISNQWTIISPATGQAKLFTLK